MHKKIITISREFGSGGRTIGKMAAEELGISCYDRELIERVAEKTGFAAEYVREQGEDVPPEIYLPMSLRAEVWMVCLRKTISGCPE